MLLLCPSGSQGKNNVCFLRPFYVCEKSLRDQTNKTIYFCQVIGSLGMRINGITEYSCSCCARNGENALSYIYVLQVLSQLHNADVVFVQCVLRVRYGLQYVKYNASIVNNFKIYKHYSFVHYLLPLTVMAVYMKT